MLRNQKMRVRERQIVKYTQRQAKRQSNQKEEKGIVENKNTYEKYDTHSYIGDELISLHTHKQ